MSKETAIKTRVTPHFTLEIDAEDGTAPKKWKLCYDYRAIAAIEEATGLDLKRLSAWKDISSGKHFPQIIHGGLRRYNPEVTLDQVIDVLNPEAQQLLSDEIVVLLFPGIREAIEKAIGATASPNVPMATPTV